MHTMTKAFLGRTMFSLFAGLASLALTVAGVGAAQPGLLKSEFIYTNAPFPSCHASTIA